MPVCYSDVSVVSAVSVSSAEFGSDAVSVSATFSKCVFVNIKPPFE